MAFKDMREFLALLDRLQAFPLRGWRQVDEVRLDGVVLLEEVGHVDDQIANDRHDPLARLHPGVARPALQGVALQQARHAIARRGGGLSREPGGGLYTGPGGGLYSGPGGGMYSGPSQYCSNIPPWDVFISHLERNGKTAEADLIRSKLR